MRKQRTMIPRVDLLRHGQTEGGEIFRGQIDVPLSEAGRMQMANAVSNRTWTSIVTSPLVRCRDFAVDLAKNIDADCKVDERLKEYGFGDWDGQAVDQVLATSGELVQRFFDDPFSSRPPNGEDFRQFTDRVLLAWTAIVEHSASEEVLVITHGGVILSILADVLGRKQLHGRIDVPYACATSIYIGSEGLPHRLLQHGSAPFAPR